MKRGWLWWVSGAVVAVAAVAWWWRPQPVPIRLAEVGRGDVLVTVVNTRAGTIKSCQRAGLSLPAGGVVAQIAVKAGDRVAQGDLLLTLWSEDIRADLARALAHRPSARPSGRSAAARRPTTSGRLAASPPCSPRTSPPAPWPSRPRTWPIPAATSAVPPVSRSGSTRRWSLRWKPVWPSAVCWRRLPAWWPRSTASSVNT